MPGERKLNEHSHHGTRQPPPRVKKESRNNLKEPVQKSKINRRGRNKSVSESKQAKTPETTKYFEDIPKEQNNYNEKQDDINEPITANEVDREENIGPRTSPELSEESEASSITSYTVNEITDIPDSESRQKESRSVSATIRRVPPQEFDIKSFNSSISDYVDVFSSAKFTKIENDYPVDDLISIVSEISTAIEDYRFYTTISQRQLEELRKRMKTVKENIRLSVTRQAFHLQDDDGYQSVEERELTEKLAKLNAAVASANVEVADAIRLSAETENTAVRAQISTGRAKMEAENIQEEIEFKSKVEKERKAEQEKIAEEARLKQEEQDRKEEQIIRAKEAEWRRREASSSDNIPVCEREKWPIHEISDPSSDGDNEALLMCTVRGHPTKFGLELIKCHVVEQADANLVFNDHEELVSQIIEIKLVGKEDEFKDPVYIGIPHFLTRAAASSREVVVKTGVGDTWIELPTREVSFENRKDVKIAQAEVRHPGILVVMSRFKQDYVTLTRNPCKITSSFDQRITFTFPRDSVADTEHLLVQVQTVDTASIQDYKTRDGKAKGLLTSSHIVHMDWDSCEIETPVTITLPCPPNPAKAKKLAQIRKLKEEKMRNPRSAPKTLAQLEEEEKKKPSKLQQLQMKEKAEGEEANKPVKKQNRWYMGEYASTEDDENDLLHFLMYVNGRWNLEPEVQIISTKIDLVTFDLPRVCDRFMVIRTRTNVLEDSVQPLAKGLSDYLAKRFVQILLRQKTDDPFEATLTVTPASRLDKTLKKLAEEGYEESSIAAIQVCVSEGDAIGVKFRGNVSCAEDKSVLRVPYNTHVHSQLYFTVSEVDKYLQKNFPMYRGLVQVSRIYTERKAVVKTIGRKQDGESEKEPEMKEELLCELLLSIPKYHIEPSAVSVKAPIKIYNTRDPVNEDTMKTLATDLGDEWKKVAYYLNVHRIRLQSILRDMNIGERTFDEAKFDMLMTWLKRVPKAANKISILGSALIKSGRSDLAEELRVKEKLYRSHPQERPSDNYASEIEAN